MVTVVPSALREDDGPPEVRVVVIHPARSYPHRSFTLTPLLSVTVPLARSERYAQFGTVSIPQLGGVEIVREDP